MSEKSELIASMLVGKTPEQISKLFSGVERVMRVEALEAAEQAEAQAASDAGMSLDELDSRLNKAISTSDFDGIRKWGELHRERLSWVTNQMEANREAELATINKPALEQKTARREALLAELDTLSRGTVSGNFEKIEQVSRELEKLS